MDATHPIVKTCVARNGKQFEYIAINIVSEKLFEYICKMGITPKKTWTMNLKQIIDSIPKQFIRDFLRGYFDGDGSINVSQNEGLKPSSFAVNISMPLDNAEWLQWYLYGLNISSSIQEDKRKYSHPFGTISFFGVNKYVFLKWIYYNECLCLQRKYDLATKYCNLVESNLTNRVENIRAIEQFKIFTEQND